MNENSGHENMVECHYRGAITYITPQLFASMVMRMNYQTSKFIRYKDGPAMYGLSLTTFKNIVRDSGALYHPSDGVALINVEKLDNYLEYFRDTV